MGKPKSRFVARAEAGKRWRIWDNQQKKWWGETYQDFPEQLLQELNGDKSPHRITTLLKDCVRKRVSLL